MSRETPEQRSARIAAALAVGGMPAIFGEPVTADQVAQAHAEAVRTLALAGGAELNPTERWLSYWGAVASNAEAQLDEIKVHGDPHGHRAEYERVVADALTHLGQFDGAARVATPEHREHLARLRDAISKPDDADCGCEEYVVEVSHPDLPDRVKRKLLPRHRAAFQVYSPRHEALVHVTECLRCGDWNARASLPDLLQQRLNAERDPNITGSDYDLLPDAP